MTARKNYHHLYLTFDNDSHPIIIEWFNRRLVEMVNLVKDELKIRGLRMDKLDFEVQGDGTAYRLSYITNFLGDSALYAETITHLAKLIDKASPYVGIRMHWDSSDVRKNRFAITKDQGLMINSTAPIEVREVGTIAKILDGVHDIWVAGEPNACRKLVGRIRYYLRQGRQSNRSYDAFEKHSRAGIGKDVAIYVRTTDEQLFGRVIHDSSYDVVKLQEPLWEDFKMLVDAGKVPDIFNFGAAYSNNYDFIAFMHYILDSVDTRRLALKGFGGSGIIPYEFITSQLEEVSE